MGTSSTVRSRRRATVRGTRSVIAAALVAVFLTALAMAVATPKASAAGGDLVWAKRYGTAARRASAVAIAAAPGGAICVAGERVNAGGVHIVVLRYRANGRRSWARLYGATRPGEEFAAAIACDRRGNVFVAGSVEAGPGDWDIVVMKYQAGGKRLWLRRYAGAGGADVHAAALAVDRNGNAYVTGTSRKPGGDLKVVAVKYTPTGKRRWVALRGPGVLGGGFALPGVDFEVSDMTLDGYGHVYVCGSARWMADERAVVLKFSRTNGRALWARIDLPGVGERSRATSIAVHKNRVVAAATLDAGTDWHMMALGFSRAGSPKYRTVYDEGPGHNIVSSDVVVDGDGDVFVAGVTELTSGATVPCVMRLLSDGAWQITAYEPLDGRAGNVHLALGRTGAVYLTWSDEWVDGPTEQSNIVARRFTNSLLGRPWIRAWRGPGHGDDRPCGIVLGTTGGLYVAGTCQGASDQTVVLKLAR